jgi:hypothetical protein
MSGPRRMDAAGISDHDCPLRDGVAPKVSTAVNSVLVVEALAARVNLD